MKISKVKIKNYRNLDGLAVSLESDCNFIVGENNVGKSNFLCLLNNIFTGRTFRFEEFKEITRPIEVEFQIRLSDVEIGQFEDFFDVDDVTAINILAVQENPDEYIKFSHAETGADIPVSSIRNINFVHYDSLRDPIAEINFDRGKGVGKFLRQIIAQYIQKSGITDNSYLDEAKLATLIESVNSTISRIKSFKDFGINAAPHENLEDLLTKVLTLRDGKGSALSKAGYGVQFLLLVTLSVLEKLFFIKQQRADRGIFVNEESGERSISLIIGLDEPEIHLHPYMQRSLIKFLNSIINNTNSDFNYLIKELFEVDRFIGQIIVVTHSPNIVLNDYKQLIRFTEKSGTVSAISGSEVELDEKDHTHLHLQFTFIKEAFFSKCVILCEGISELGSFPHFAATLGIEFDDLGICVIQCQGNQNVAPLLRLMEKFGIAAVGITDKDDGKYPPINPNHFETSRRDFEAEISALIDLGKEDVLRSIAKSIDLDVERSVIQAGSLTKYAFTKHKLCNSPFTVGMKLADLLPADLASMSMFYVTWFSKEKSIQLGMMIGQTLKDSEIPEIYRSVIAEAKRIAEDA